MSNGVVNFHLDEIDAWRSGQRASPEVPAAGARYAERMLDAIKQHELALMALGHKPTIDYVIKHGFADGQRGKFSANHSHVRKKTTELKDIEPGLRNVARRSIDAENRFLDYAMEHGRLSRGQATTALTAFRKARVITFDAVNGTFHVKHGQFLEPDVLRRAAGLEE